MFTKQSLSVASFTAKTRHNPIIAGVLMMPDGCAATDSYSLAEVKMKHVLPHLDFPVSAESGNATVAFTEPIVVPAKAATALAASIPTDGSKSLPALERAAFAGKTEESATFLTTDLETSQTHKTLIVEGKFPEYAKLMPTSAPLASVKLNPDYLLKAAKLLKEINKGQVFKHLTLELRGEGEPVILRAETGEHVATVLVMPIRS